MKIIGTILTVIFLNSCSSVKENKKIPVDKKTIGLLPTEKKPDLVEVAQFEGIQVTGITAAKGDRLFASVPRLRKNVPFSVVEIMKNGSYKAYPNEDWNNWKGKLEKNIFISVQSVLADGDYLYVLDSASPEMKGIVAAPRLYRFDLRTNKLDKSWEFNFDIIPLNTYLNDLRVDGNSNKAFISDSGLGAIIVLDLKTGKSNRLLGKHPSTKSENVVLTVDKKEFKKKTHSDGLALSPIDQKLYYHALTGYNLYRVPTDALETDIQNETSLVKKVEKMGVTPAPDGMIFDEKGNLFMGDLERNAISYRTPSGEMKILVQDERIKWPDSLTIDGKRNLIFTDSNFAATEIGKSVNGMVFKVYRVELPDLEKEKM